MATANFFAPGFDDQIEQQSIERKRKMAELLRQQSTQPDQGRMVGNYYVPQSWTQSLAKMLGGVMADKEESGADQSQRALAEAVKGRTSAAMEGFTKALNPSQLGTGATNMVNDALPEELRVGAQPALSPRQPDIGAAYKALMDSGVGGLQQAGLQGSMSYAQEQAKKAQEMAAQSKQLEILRNAGSPQAAIAAGVPDKVVKAYYESPNYGKEELIGVNGRMVGKLSGKQVGEEMPKQLDPTDPRKDLLIPDGKGGFMPNAPLVGVKKEIGKSSASNISNVVSVAGPENKYNETVGKGVADADLAALDAAKSAPEVVRNAQMVRDALKTAITGTGADARYSIQKAMETAGIVGEGKAASTEAVMAGMAKMTQAAVKASGLGGGSGFSNADRDFLEKAAGGQISTTKENLLRAAELSEGAARAAHAKGSVFLKNAKENPALANVVKSTMLDEMPSGATPNGGRGGGFEILNVRP